MTYCNKRGYLYRQVVFRFENRGFRKSVVFEKRSFQKVRFSKRHSFQKGVVFEKRGFWKGTVFKKCSFCGFKTTPFKTIWPYFIEYPIDSPQESYELIFVLCTHLTPFKTISPNFIIVYPIDSFEHHVTCFLYCVPNWLLSRPFDPIVSLCTQLTPFKTIWPNFIIVYPIDSFQDHLT